MRQVGGFLRVFWFPLPIKTDRHDIAEILLKVALNTIAHNLNLSNLQSLSKKYIINGRSGSSLMYPLLSTSRW